MSNNTDNNQSSGSCLGSLITIGLIIGVIVYVVSLFQGCESSPFKTINNNTNNYNINIDIENHPCFEYKDKGDCRKLTGDIAVTTIFVDDVDSSWSNSEIDQNLANKDIYLSNIREQAKDYGLDINIHSKSFHTVVTTSITSYNEDDWIGLALTNARLPLFSHMGGYLEDLYSVDEAPVLFFIDKPGTSYYVRSDSSDDFEYAVIFSGTKDFRPMLYSLYGATDFNDDSSMKASAQTYFPDSLMLSADSFAITDSLTAYTIGWLESLDENAENFLVEIESDSSTISSSQTTTSSSKSDILTVSDAGPIQIPKTVTKDKNGNHNGYERVYYTDCVFAGHFVDGYKEGHGEVSWDLGDEFVGNFQDNDIHGFGSYYFENGDIYSGNFSKGKIDGNGEYTWASGDKYDGAFKNGMRDGYGTMIYSDHTQISGMWENNEFLYAAED